MRKVEIAGKEYIVNPLTYGAIKRLRADGVDLFGPLSWSRMAGGDSALEAVICAAGLDISGLDDAPYPELLKLFNAVLYETVGREEEVKN